MTQQTLAPSGTQHELVLGGQRAVVVEVGGGIRSYDVDGRPVIDGYDEDAAADGGRGQTLVPWPNRVRDGQWSWQGSDQQLALTEPDEHHAIHGLLRWQPWQTVDVGAATATLGVTLHPQPGYPFSLDVTNAWSLSETGLSVTTSVVNRSADPAPLAVGYHPYLSAGGGLVDELTLHVPGRTQVLVDDRSIPCGTAPVGGTDVDFTSGRRIGDAVLDVGFTDLERDSDGRVRVVLERPHEPSLTLWADEAFDHLQVFTGDTLSDPDRRRRGLAVEPMTAPANALASGEGLVVLQPGAGWSGSWGIQVAVTP